MATTAMGSSAPQTMARGDGWDSMAPVKRGLVLSPLLDIADRAGNSRWPPWCEISSQAAANSGSATEECGLKVLGQARLHGRSVVGDRVGQAFVGEAEQDLLADAQVAISM